MLSLSLSPSFTMFAIEYFEWFVWSTLWHISVKCRVGFIQKKQKIETNTIQWFGTQVACSLFSKFIVWTLFRSFFRCLSIMSLRPNVTHCTFSVNLTFAQFDRHLQNLQISLGALSNSGKFKRRAQSLENYTELLCALHVIIHVIDY